MRTTVTLDDDLFQRIRELANRRGQSVKVTLNEVLRRGLSAPQAEAERPEPFVVQPQPGGLRPGIDPAHLNQLVDELGLEDFAEKRQTEA